MTESTEQIVMAIAFGCIAIVVGLLWRDARKAPPGPYGQKPYGVHGVLAWFVFGFYFLGPLYLLGNTSIALGDAESAIPQSGAPLGWDVYKAYIWVATAVILVWNVRVGYLLKNRFVPSSANAAKIFLLTAPLLNGLAEETAARVLFNISGGEELLIGTAKSFGHALFWFLYLTISRRVKNTYYFQPDAGYSAAPTMPVGPEPVIAPDAGRFSERQTAQNRSRQEPSLHQISSEKTERSVQEGRPEPEPQHTDMASPPAPTPLDQERHHERDHRPAEPKNAAAARHASMADGSADAAQVSAKDLAWQRLERSIQNASAPREALQGREAASPAAPDTKSTLEERLATAKRLLDLGYITHADYDQKKTEILGRL